MFELAVGIGFFGFVAVVLFVVWLVLLIARYVHERRTRADRIVRGTLLGERMYPTSTPALLKKPEHPLLMPKETVRRSARAEAKRDEQAYRTPREHLYDSFDTGPLPAVPTTRVVGNRVVDTRKDVPTTFIPDPSSAGNAGSE